MPIVGFNVIEEITKQPVDCASAGVGESVVDALSSSLTRVENEKVAALVNLIKTESVQELCSIKARKQEKLIPKGQSVIVSCRAAIGPVARSQCYLNSIQTRPTLLILKYQKRN